MEAVASMPHLKSNTSVQGYDLDTHPYSKRVLFAFPLFQEEKQVESQDVFEQHTYLNLYRL